jgi:4-hydroxybenzoate polyprenyltransferase
MANPLDLLPALVVGLAVLFWVAGFDIIYSCQDYEYDVRARLKSVPSRFGVPGALRIALGCHLAMIAMLISLPFIGGLAGYPVQLGWIYWIGVASVSGLMIYEHSLVKPSDLSRVNVAFFNVNAVVSIGLFAIVTLDLFI